MGLGLKTAWFCFASKLSPSAELTIHESLAVVNSIQFEALEFTIVILAIIKTNVYVVFSTVEGLFRVLYLY